MFIVNNSFGGEKTQPDSDAIYGYEDVVFRVFILPRDVRH